MYGNKQRCIKPYKIVKIDVGLTLDHTENQKGATKTLGTRTCCTWAKARTSIMLDRPRAIQMGTRPIGLPVCMPVNRY